MRDFEHIVCGVIARLREFMFYYAFTFVATRFVLYGYTARHYNFHLSRTFFVLYARHRAAHSRKFSEVSEQVLRLVEIILRSIYARAAVKIFAHTLINVRKIHAHVMLVAAGAYRFVNTRVNFLHGAKHFVFFQTVANGLQTDTSHGTEHVVAFARIE